MRKKKEKDFDAEFWDIVVYNASLDPELVKCVRWLLYKSLDISDWATEEEYFSLSNYMSENWGLNHERFHQAMEIRETAEFESANG